MKYWNKLLQKYNIKDTKKRFNYLEKIGILALYCLYKRLL